ncbi:MAG: hypothetical protein GY708_10560 [Actinomycetia bacterium]|nr:hypothetical protein [Actinomycetes bacterium]MCP4963529.1 hypothetical protein [Actinomycetes bacterium]
MATIIIDTHFQGPTGSGQGGWTSAQLAQEFDGPATIAIRAPIPLETEMWTERSDGKLDLMFASGDTPVVVLEAETWEPHFPTTEAVSIADAAQARTHFPLLGEDHPVPYCFSCGLQHDSMCVHAASLGDGRFATDWTPPAWTDTGDGSVTEAAAWAALDCTAAWFACTEGEIRVAFTVQLAVEVLTPFIVGETYALVSWEGDGRHGWDGRKRTAASAAFNGDGECVAHSRSLWVSPT